MGAETRTECGSVSAMARSRKITVEVPAELLEKAQEESGAGITKTVRAGLQLVAALWGVWAVASTPGKGPVFAKFGPVEV